MVNRSMVLVNGDSGDEITVGVIVMTKVYRGASHVICLMITLDFRIQRAENQFSWKCFK